DLLEAQEHIVHVPRPTVGPLEVVTLERFERPLAGPIDPGNAVLERREPVIAAAWLDGDIRPAQKRSDQNDHVSGCHVGSLPRPRVRIFRGSLPTARPCCPDWRLRARE